MMNMTLYLVSLFEACANLEVIEFYKSKSIIHTKFMLLATLEGNVIGSTTKGALLEEAYFMS